MTHFYKSKNWIYTSRVSASDARATSVSGFTVDFTVITFSQMEIFFNVSKNSFYNKYLFRFNNYAAIGAQEPFSIRATVRFW